MNDLVRLLQEDGFQMTRVAGTNGGEYHGSCPSCARRNGDAGGDDRLCGWPNHPDSDCGKAWCRVCGDVFNGIDYLRSYRGMSLREACTKLGVRRDFSADSCRQRPEVCHKWQPSRAKTPSAKWIAQAEQLLRHGRKTMFETEVGEAALDKLATTRLLKRKTVEAARLGLLRRDQYIPKSHWGIVVDPDKTKRDLWIPAGLLIPVMHNDEPTSLQVRRRPESTPRYVKISGSGNRCMWMGSSDAATSAVVVVESALDAILLWQELPGDIAVVALGSVSIRPDAETAAKLAAVPLVLVALDGDDAGAAQAIQWWERNLPNTSRLAYPARYGAKDPTELAIAAGSTEVLRVWVQTGISIAQSRHLPVAMGSSTHGVTAAQEAAPVQPERRTPIKVGTSLDMRVTVIEDAAGTEAAIARIAAFEGVSGLDTETAPLPDFADDAKAALDPYKSRARTLQVCMGDEVFVFDLNRVDVHALSPIVARPWAGHNAAFDLSMLTHAGLECSVPDCTMLLANTLDNAVSSLRDLASKHLGIELDKGVRTTDWSGDLSREQVEYAARDAWVTFRLHRLLGDQAERRGRMRLYGLLKGAQSAVVRMELSGIGFDAGAHERLIAAWQAELEGLMADVHAAFGDDFNPHSCKQVGELLLRHLDADSLAAWPRTKSGELSTAAADLAIGADHPALASVAASRGLRHALSGFGETLASCVHPVTDRVHPHLLIAAQSTGRFSCTGPNMHGIPRDPRVRSLFVAGPGRAIVAADFGMIQLRIAALISRDTRLVNATERGEDLHRLTASLLMSKAPEDVTREERSLVKPVNFGLLFCMGAPTLWRYARSNYGVRMSLADAEQFRAAYFRAYPGIRAWHSDVHDCVTDCGKVCTPYGRWSSFGKSKDISLPAAAAHVIQGAEAEVMLATLGRLPDALRGLDALPVACIHDELVLDVAEADVPAAEAAVRGAMEQGMRDVFPKAPLIGLVDAKHGPNWHAAK